MFGSILVLCAIAIQMTNACNHTTECPFGKFTCTRLKGREIISFEAELSLKRLTFNSFTLGNGRGRECKVDTFPAAGEDGDMAFVRMKTGLGKGLVDCGIEETHGGRLSIDVWVKGSVIGGVDFELHFKFPGHDFTGKDRTYLADTDDPSGIVECFCKNGGECVRDEEKATVYCKCPKLYTGRLCTEHTHPTTDAPTCKNRISTVDTNGFRNSTVPHELSTCATDALTYGYLLQSIEFYCRRDDVALKRTAKRFKRGFLKFFHVSSSIRRYIDRRGGCNEFFELEMPKERDWPMEEGFKTALGRIIKLYLCLDNVADICRAGALPLLSPDTDCVDRMERFTHKLVKRAKTMSRLLQHASRAEFDPFNEFLVERLIHYGN